MSWRLNWTLRELVDVRSYREISGILDAPLTYYGALLLKLIPGLFAKQISLRLKDGYVVPVQEFMSLYIFKEIFVEKCYDVLLDAPSPVILDIGANTGLFALRMKQLFPSSRITCYEPYPPNFRRLQDLIAINDLTSVVPMEEAVGAKSGTAQLYVHRRNVGGHSLSPRAASSDRHIDVVISGVDAVLRRLATRIDLLKADCEGAEYEILMSFTPEHAARVRRIVIEPMPQLYDIQTLCSHLEALGYARQWKQGLFFFTHTQQAGSN